jgi:hypothetical protein
LSCKEHVGQAFQPAGSGDFPVARSNTGLESPVNRQTGKSALQGWPREWCVPCFVEPVVSRRAKILWVMIPSVCIIAALYFAIPAFVRAHQTKARNACMNNLRQIDGAKQQWALENQKTGNDVPSWNDINAYVDTNKLHCQDGGVYTLGRVKDAPKCSIGGPGHTLN